MNPIRQALAERLKDDATLVALATGGIHHVQVPANTSPPYVVFSKASGIPLDAFDGPSLDNDVWLVKGIGERDIAEEISERCLVLLDKTTLNIQGRANQDLRRISDVDFTETITGERFDHVGHEYRIRSEEENS